MTISEKINALSEVSDLSSYEHDDAINDLIRNIANLSELAEFIEFLSSNVDKIYEGRRVMDDAQYLSSLSRVLYGATVSGEVLIPSDYTSDYSKMAWTLYYTFSND